jgi:hypothetical protein
MAKERRPSRRTTEGQKYESVKLLRDVSEAFMHLIA